MKIIFLDIDGVICTARAHVAAGYSGQMTKLDPVVIGFLNRLTEIDDATRIVISSTWRKSSSKTKLLKVFQEVGFEGKFHSDWRTPDGHNGFRGDQVAAWLEKHPEISTYICIDDDKDFHPDQPLIHTQNTNGMMYEDFEKACQLLHGTKNAWFVWKNAQLTQQQNQPQRPDGCQQHGGDKTNRNPT